MAGVNFRYDWLNSIGVFVNGCFIGDIYRNSGDFVIDRSQVRGGVSITAEQLREIADELERLKIRRVGT